MRRKKQDEIWEEEARQKLEAIYLTHRSMMFSTAMRILNQHADAEDAVQNCMISLAGHMDAVGDVSDYRTISYINTAVRHAAIDIYRKKKTGELSYEELLIEPEDSFDIEKSICENEEIAHIIKTISGLNATYKEVLSLYYINELSPREIAKLMHIPYNTVRARISRGKKILLENLKKGESI